MARRSASRYTYGMERMELLGSSMSAIFLMALCFTVMIKNISLLAAVSMSENGYDGLIHNTAKDFSHGMIVAVLGLLVNFITLLAAKFCLIGGHACAHGHHHHHHGNTHENAEMDQENQDG